MTKTLAVIISVVVLGGGVWFWYAQSQHAGDAMMSQTADHSDAMMSDTQAGGGDTMMASTSAEAAMH